MFTTWDDARVCAMDYETSGVRPEFALQTWRIPKGEMWPTSLAWVWPEAGTLRHAGSTMPARGVTEQFLQWAIAENRIVFGWNTAFDISVAMALGFRDLCFKIKWMDGRLLWRHLCVEPEYDDGPRKPYGLKDYVREFMPEFAGYEADVDYHDQSPDALAKLHHYNIQDNVFTLKACRTIWRALEARQRQAAWIEADAIPLVADANLRGLLIDTVACQDLMLKLKAKADGIAADLAPAIVEGLEPGTKKQQNMSMGERAAAVVASPQQLAALLFDRWGLPVQKMNPLTAKQAEKPGAQPTRSTDKEVLFELAFLDPRAKLLREYREALNCSKKFAETPLVAARYNEDGRAHPLAIMFGTYSGRFTYASKQKNRKKGADHVAEEAQD